MRIRATWGTREDYAFILFWFKVNRHGPFPVGAPHLGQCWLWTAALNSRGYGSFANGKGGSMPAHRFAYELFVGPIPDGLTIDHLCRIRSCVRPTHLEAVTNLENVMRGESFSVFNSRKTHCLNGHPLTPDAVYEGRRNRACRHCAIDRSKAWYTANHEAANARRRAEYRAAHP